MPHRNVIIGLLAIVIAFLAISYQRSSPAWFGYYHDDSIYWSSAQALAAGEGYRLPSVPGEPLQTKYPVFYSWLLSWVWRVNPDFPGNIAWAQAITLLSGLGFLAGAYTLLRQLGAAELEAVGLTALCALHPVMVHLSGFLLSDVPFMAFAVWSLVLSQLALSRRDAGHPAARKYWWGATLCAVLVVLTRSIGIAVVFGIAVCAVFRRAYREAALLLGTCLPFFAASMLWSRQAQGGWSADPGSGFEQTAVYYTSYLGFWLLCVPDLQTLWMVVTFNLTELLKGPAVLTFLVPAAGFAPGAVQAGAVALSFAVFKGIMDRARSHGAHPIHFAVVLYAGLMLIWNYALVNRFLLPFLPLFLAGASLGIGQIGRSAAALLKRPAPWAERVATAALALLVGGLLGYGGQRYFWDLPAGFAATAEHREALRVDKLEAYSWVRANAASEDRFIVDEDVSFYLHTGRQALRPMAYSTATFYRQDMSVLDHDLERMTDTARALKARYWVASTDDYHLDGSEKWIRERTEELLATMPAVFESRTGGVTIYDISSLHESAGIHVDKH